MIIIKLMLVKNHEVEFPRDPTVFFRDPRVGGRILQTVAGRK